MLDYVYIAGIELSDKTQVMKERHLRRASEISIVTV